MCLRKESDLYNYKEFFSPISYFYKWGEKKTPEEVKWPGRAGHESKVGLYIKLLNQSPALNLQEKAAISEYGAGVCVQEWFLWCTVKTQLSYPPKKEYS